LIRFREGGVANIDLDKNEDPVKLNNLGVKYYNKGKYKIALNYFDKALAVAPQFDDAKRNRIYCIQMLRQKKPEQSVPYSNKNYSYDYNRSQSIAKKEPVEVHPLDYNASRFSAHHQFGKIPTKDEFSGSNYYKPYWENTRR